MFVLPFALIPAAMSGPGPPDRDVNERGLVEVPENAVRDEPIAFGLTAIQLGICAMAVLVAAILNVLPIWEPIRLVLVLLGAGPIALAAAAGPGQARLSLGRPRSSIPARFAVLERNARGPDKPQQAGWTILREQRSIRR